MHAEIDDTTFRQFADLIYEKAGIHLGPHKRALVTSRLNKRMRQLGITDFGDYYDYVHRDASREELVKLLDAISTNVTQFYRESKHFRILQSLLREWEANGQSRFRIWCAAASTGEEPYTIAITVQESLNYSADTKILATDLSTQALETAKRGRYGKRKLETVPAELRSKYFHQKGRGLNAEYVVKDELKRMIRFAWLNLSAPPFPMRGPLDVVFCRNVMIYFDNTVRSRLLEEVHRLLKPGGYLMVGHAESLSGILSNFKSVEPSVYVKRK